MVEVNFSGNFLNSENCKANDLGVFINEGEMIDRESKGKKWQQLMMSVQVNEKEYSHGFRSSEGKKFQEAYSNDTKNWIGKKFSIVFIPWVDKDDNNKIKQNVELIPVEGEAKTTTLQEAATS